MNHLKISVLIAFGFLLAACDSKPRVIEGEPVIQTDGAALKDPSVLVRDADPEAQHQVVVKEALNTPRYSYLRVEEDGSEFWIALPQKEVKIGGTYYYKGGLLKRNFQSQEFDRIFETVYLVSDVWPHPITSDGSAISEALAGREGGSGGAIDIVPAAGAVKISDLISNRTRYDGKVIKVTGKCVKVNPRIMNRNWVHIQDGSADNLDLTVTTDENIPVGAVVTLEGAIALNKDFGAGYVYQVIMEDAVLK